MRNPFQILVALGVLALAVDASAAISVSPKRVVAGETGRVTIRLSGEGRGAWQIAASEGKVSALAAQADGSAVATLTLSEDRKPRVVQIAAWRQSTTNPSEVEFAELSVSGRVVLPVQTEPRATVSVTVAGVRFGPATADGQGRAALELTVPPGVRTARVEVLSTAGGRSTERLNLGTPGFNQLFGVVLPARESVALVLSWAPAAEALKPSAIRFDGVSFRSIGTGRFVGVRPGVEAFSGAARAGGSRVKLVHTPSHRSPVEPELDPIDARGEARQPHSKASLLAMAGARGLVAGNGPELLVSGGWSLFRHGLFALSVGATTGVHYGFASPGGTLLQITELPLIAELTADLSRNGFRFAASAGAGGEYARIDPDPGQVRSELLPALQFRARAGVQGGPGYMFVAADARVPLLTHRLGSAGSALGGLGLFLGYELTFAD